MLSLPQEDTLFEERKENCASCKGGEKRPPRRDRLRRDEHRTEKEGRHPGYVWRGVRILLSVSGRGAAFGEKGGIYWERKSGRESYLVERRGKCRGKKTRYVVGGECWIKVHSLTGRHSR